MLNHAYENSVDPGNDFAFSYAEYGIILFKILSLVP